MCSKDDWCPHAVQVALPTGRVGTPGKEGGTITPQNVIATQDAAEEVEEGSLMRRGGRGTTPR